jgi:hypothetical protein
MSADTRRLIRCLLSALVAGVIAGGSVILGSVSADGQVKPGTWLIAGVMCLTALAKDMQASLSTPPEHVLPGAHPQKPK